MKIKQLIKFKNANINKIIILLFFIFSFKFTFGQQSKIDLILDSKVYIINQIDTNSLDKKIYLKTDFSSSEIINPSEIDKIKNKIITKVELIFTTYSTSQSFNQKELNKKRLYSLYSIYPEIFNNDLINWQLIGQTKCNNNNEGNEYFHGFIITYREEYSEKTIENEIKYIENTLDGKDPFSNEEKIITPITYNGKVFNILQYLQDSTNYPEQALENGLSGTIVISFDIDEEGKTVDIKILKGSAPVLDSEMIRVVNSIPQLIPRKENNVPIKTHFIIPFSFNISGESLPIEDLSIFQDSTQNDNFFIYDSTIITILNRNSNWENMLIVTDITGSMAPYTVQLLIWYKLNLKSNDKKISLLTFFNDGDNKSDNQKNIGKTGGIYSTSSKDFNTIKKLVIKSMKTGNGGDIPENNIEALIYGINNCPNCNDIIMIADNFATPRDLILLNEIKKPIKIILCGTEGGINTEYLNIARKTKGSIHTIEEDIKNLMDLNEGDTITIQNHIYKINNGKFIRMK